MSGVPLSHLSFLARCPQETHRQVVAAWGQQQWQDNSLLPARCALPSPCSVCDVLIRMHRVRLSTHSVLTHLPLCCLKMCQLVWATESSQATCLMITDHAPCASERNRELILSHSAVKEKGYRQDGRLAEACSCMAVCKRHLLVLVAGI